MNTDKTGRTRRRKVYETLTPEEIQTRGLAALKRELGVVGMVRFIQQLDPGRGDYTKERHKWVDRFTMNDLRKELRRMRAAKKRRKTG